jgi:hypothetical protein
LTRQRLPAGDVLFEIVSHRCGARPGGDDWRHGREIAVLGRPQPATAHISFVLCWALTEVDFEKSIAAWRTEGTGRVTLKRLRAKSLVRLTVP